MKIIRLEVEDFQRIEVVAINANGEAVVALDDPWIRYGSFHRRDS